MGNTLEALLARIPTPGEHAGRPFVTISYAQSLDGCIAARPGTPLALSGPETMTMTHHLRAAHDAILIGIGTVLADDPRLTVRLAPGGDPQPVVLDSRLRFPLDAALLDHPKKPWIATLKGGGLDRATALEEAGARILHLPPDEDHRPDLSATLTLLDEMGMRSTMVEGGAGVITAFLAKRLVDAMVITIAPVVIGGLRAVGDLGPDGLTHRPRLRSPSWGRFGADFVVWGEVEWERA